MSFGLWWASVPVYLKTNRDWGCILNGVGLGVGKQNKLKNDRFCNVCNQLAYFMFFF